MNKIFLLKSFLISLFLCQLFLGNKIFSMPTLDDNHISTSKKIYDNKIKIQVIDEAINVFKEENINTTLLKKYKEKIIENSLSIEEENNLIFEILKYLEIPKNYTSDDYNNSYSNLYELYNTTYEEISKNIPKIIHFILLGGPLGEIQKDYIKIWHEINPDYKINIWYDSNAIFSYRAKKYIEKFFQKINPESYPDNIIKTQNYLYQILKKKEFFHDLETIKFLNQNLNLNTNSSQSNNQILTDEELNSEVNMLRTEMNSSIHEVENYGKRKILFRDISLETKAWKSKNLYLQELNLKMNFAGAGDIARLEILKQYGGIYLDVDIQPKLKDEFSFLNQKENRNLKKFSKNEDSKLNKIIDILMDEAIKNQNIHMKNFRKGRKFSTEYFNSNSQELLKAKFSGDKNLESVRFLEELPEKYRNATIKELFKKLEPNAIKQGELVLGQYDNNNVIACHKSTDENDMISKLMNQIEKNYETLSFALDGVNGKNKTNGTKIEIRSKIEFGNNKFEILKTIFQNKNNPNFMIHILNYRYDGYDPKARATAYISGPKAYLPVFEKHYKKFILLKPKINHIFNSNTEEDAKSSWLIKENIINLPEEC